MRFTVNPFNSRENPKQEPETGSFAEVSKNLAFAHKSFPAGCLHLTRALHSAQRIVLGQLMFL